MERKIEQKEFTTAQYRGFRTAMDQELYSDVVKNIQDIRDKQESGERRQFVIQILPDEDVNKLRAQIRKVGEYMGVRLGFWKDIDGLHIWIPTDEEWEKIPRPGRRKESTGESTAEATEERPRRARKSS
jgi:hypothetical protein